MPSLATSLLRASASLLIPCCLLACSEGTDDPLVGTGGTGGGSGSGGGFVFGAAGALGTADTSWNGGGECNDACPHATGLPVACKRRFMYGVNWGWKRFGVDFGGLTAWNQRGVSRDPNGFGDDLLAMHDGGVNAVRWWLFPDFRGDGVTFRGDTPTGLGGTLLDDLEMALQLAEATDVYLMLCLFSFDGFRPRSTEAQVVKEGLAPIVKDPTLRRELVEKVVRPIAAAVERSPFRHRMLAWDVINEPEWAMTGESGYGDPPYTPTEGFEWVTHGEMETFVSEVITGLRVESRAQITVGSAAAKWSRAWTHVDIDFYQLHTYDWVNRWFPYDRTPAEYGLGDKPVVMGEFPVQSLCAEQGTTSCAKYLPYETLLETWYAKGYAGALSWSFNDANFPFEDHRAAVAAFAAKHACETNFSR